MLIKIFLIPFIATFFTSGSSKHNNVLSNCKTTVIGTAVVIKNDAAVRTDDNQLYYLDGIYNWDDEYINKRVKVTGKLVVKIYNPKKRSHPVITATPQHRLGRWKIIKKPKWSLVQ